MQLFASPTFLTLF